MKKLVILALTLLLCIGLCSCDLVIAAGTSPKADAATLYREGFSKLTPRESMNVCVSAIMDDGGDEQEQQIDLAYVIDENGQIALSLRMVIAVEDERISMSAVYVDGWVYETYEYNGEVEKNKYCEEMDVEELMTVMLAYGPSEAVAKMLANAEITKNGNLSTFSCELDEDAACEAFAYNLLLLMMTDGDTVPDREPGMAGSISVTVNEEGYLVKIEETYTVDGETATLVTEFPNPGEPVVITAPADADSYIES